MRGLRLLNPFVLRTVEPAPRVLIDRPLCQLHRIGKRMVISSEDECHAVIHLMIAGRLRWLPTGKNRPREAAWQRSILIRGRCS